MTSFLLFIQEFHYSFQQTIWDSEEDFINETFWDINPLFLLVKEGKTEELKNSLNLQLDQFDFRQRITKDQRKQLEYMAVSLVNTFMIAGIQGGIYPPEANWIADKALRKLLAVRAPAEISPIIQDAALELSEKVNETKEMDTGNPYVEKARHFMLTHLTREISVVQIADHVGISQYYLSRLFKSVTGQTLMQYLSEERLNAARHLLTTTDQPIHEIAVLLRFCDQSHMTYVFRKKYGITPKQYRDTHNIPR